MKLIFILNILVFFCIIQLSAQDLSQPIVEQDLVFEEVNGIVAVEGEHFYKQSNNEIRQWYITSTDNIPDVPPDHDGDHTNGASNSSYIEILPDTRVSHADKLIHGENFSNIPGILGIVHYKVKINNPGRYYVWVRTYSTGSEDNGIHVGFNGNWPESGQRMQWCEGKNEWTWASKQRTEKVHCGVPGLIFLDFEEADIYDMHFSMREDGFEMDKFILVNNPDYIPEGVGPNELRIK